MMSAVKDTGLIKQPHGGAIHPPADSERAVEIGRKGGNANTLKQYLTRKKKCVTKGRGKNKEPECKLADRCPMVVLGLQNNRCEINAMDEGRRNRTLRLLAGSPEAIEDELMVQMGKLLVMAEENPSMKGQAMIVDKLMAMFKTVFDKGPTMPEGGNTYIFNWQVPSTSEEKVVEAEVEKEERE